MDPNSQYTEVKNSIDELGSVVEQFIKTNDERLDKVASKAAISDVTVKLEKVERDLGTLEEKRAKIERELEAERARREALEQTLATGGSVKNTKLLEDHRDAFLRGMKSGWDPEIRQELKLAQRKYTSSLPQEKQVNLGSAAAGEALVPELIRIEQEQFELNLSPIRRLIPVINVTTTDFKEVVDIRGTASGWLAETGTRSVTNSPTLRVVTPTWGELYARPQATEWAAMDISGLSTWLARSVAEEFVRAEGIAVISGNGSSKPTGLFNTATVTTDDDASPLRAAAAFEHIVAPSPDDIVEHMLMLIYGLKAQYRMGAKWAMNSATLGLVRRAKASDGHYLWQPSLVQGQPAMIAGYEFEVLENLDDVGLSPVGDPIVFGNWARAYLLAQRSDINVLFDPYTTIGLQSWWFRRREGGIPKNNEALKVAAR